MRANTQQLSVPPDDITWWRRFTTPTITHNTLDRNHKAKLLSRTLIILLGVVLAVDLLVFIQDLQAARFPLDSAFITPMLGALSLSYILNQRGHYQTAVYIFLGGAYLVLTTFSTQDFTVALYYVSLLLVSGMFLPERQLRLLAVLVLVSGVVIAIMYFNSPRTTTTIMLVNFTLINIPMVLVYMANLRRAERDRRAQLERTNQVLRENEAHLELRVKERTVELEDARHEIQAALEKALQADKLKSQFLASMSHELRTPLNSILTFTELMQMGTFGDVNNEQVDYLGKSLQSGRHLLSLINDVLDITKIQSGMMKLFVENDFDIHKEVEIVAETARTLLGDKPVDLLLDIDNNFPSMTCDKRRIRQVMLNLMSNAVKFTEHGSITISAKYQRDTLLFAVIDTGPGIAADQHHLIFEPFIQTETGLQHAAGTGLGLPISKRLIEAHGGDLWVESDKGEGAAFFVRLPLEPDITLGETEM